MICQLCLAKVATRDVAERSSDGRLVEAQYCQECYDAKYEHPSPVSAPRPRFTIKSFMILVCVWALPNSVTAWIVRSGWITGTPAQLRLWTIQSFLAVNLVFGFFFVWFGLMIWLSRLMWHNQTGGLVPMPKQKLTRKQRVALLVRLPLLLVPLLVLQVGVLFLAEWLAAKFPVMSRRQWFALIALAALLPFAAVTFLKNFKDNYLNDRVRQLWRTASRTERALRAAALGWTFGLAVIAVIAVSSPRVLFWGFTMWFPIPPFILAWVVVQLALLGAVAIAARRR
jgi:hypothetical protein